MDNINGRFLSVTLNTHQNCEAYIVDVKLVDQIRCAHKTYPKLKSDLIKCGIETTILLTEAIFSSCVTEKMADRRCPGCCVYSGLQELHVVQLYDTSHGIMDSRALMQKFEDICY